MTKFMIKATDPRVQSWYDHVQSLPKDSVGHFIAGNKCNDNGYLYVIGNPKKGYGIQPWLPQDLLEYANASSGTSGDRPVGIRVWGFDTIDQAAEKISEIFESPETVAEFLNSSDCDYSAVRTGGPKPAKPTTALEMFWKKYNKQVAQALTKKYGLSQVRQAIETMTLVEFEQQFDLDKLQRSMSEKQAVESV